MTSYHFDLWHHKWWKTNYTLPPSLPIAGHMEGIFARICATIFKDLSEKGEQTLFANPPQISPINRPRGGGFLGKKLSKSSQTLAKYFLTHSSSKPKTKPKREKNFWNPRASIWGTRILWETPSQDLKIFGTPLGLEAEGEGRRKGKKKWRIFRLRASKSLGFLGEHKLRAKLEPSLPNLWWV